MGLVVLLILYELWAGERLSLEKATPRYLRPGRPISVSAVPFGPGIDIWRSCRFIGALMRSLCLLPGGLGSFVACSIGANNCRLRHIGWEKCSHGLTSRPRESASLHFLDELLALFRYPSGSGRALLAGTLPLRYCSARFACLTPSWRLPVHGFVGDLVAAYSDAGRRAAVVGVISLRGAPLALPTFVTTQFLSLAVGVLFGACCLLHLVGFFISVFFMVIRVLILILGSLL